MSEIRVLSAEDFDTFVDVAIGAYPGWREDREQIKRHLLREHESPTAKCYGAFRDGRLQGGMVLYDFRMNFLDARITAGGVGGISVDLQHKKEHIAGDMMLFFLRHYRERGAPLTMLYPFRPDLYQRTQ